MKNKRLKGEVVSRHIDCAVVSKFESENKVIKPDNASQQFKWYFEGDGLPKEFTKSVKFDYQNQTIKVEYYNIVTEKGYFHADFWVKKIEKPEDVEAVRNRTKEEVVFTLCDKYGKLLYKMIFKDLRIVEHTNYFDGNVLSDSFDAFTIKYKSLEKVYFI